MSENPADILVSHFGNALWVVVECGNNGKDGSSRIGCELHIAQVDAVEGCFADAEYERTALFQSNVGRALNEVGGEAIRDGCECTHGAGKDDRCGRGVAAAGDAGSYVGVGVLMDFRRGYANKLFHETVAAADLEFFREDAE